MNLQSLTKEEAISVLNNHPHLGVKEFKTILSTLKASSGKFRVSSVKVGDIFKVVSLGCHPVVIISINCFEHRRS